MAQTQTLTAETRDRAGKGAAREARRAGLVPAVIYGGNEAPISITLNGRALVKALETAGFFTQIINLEVGDAKHKVLARDVQFHPVRDEPMHVDFLRVSDRTRVAVMVPVTFVNEDKSPGLKQGGVLNVVRHEVELMCGAASIPDDLVVDMGGSEIGDSIHISQVTLPAGATPTITDRDFTIATIAAPSVVKEAAEATEGGEADAAAESE